MPSRVTLFITAAAVVASVLAPAAGQPAVAPAPKNFTEKLTSFKIDENSKQKFDMKAQFDMVYVPGGEVTVGSPDDEPGRDKNEGPRYKAKVGGFWMGKCEVTWDEFELFWHDNSLLVANDDRAKEFKADAITRPTNTFVDETYEHGRDGHPVLCMTHHSAWMYCHWLRKKTGKNYRLPTEAEWEYAARGGKGDAAYSFGNDPAGLPDHAWFKDNSPDPDNFPNRPKGCTHKVGTRKANPFGLHDLYGNVSEWALDQHDPATYARRAAIALNLNPVVVPTADKWSHIVRGGSWADKAERCRSAARRTSEKSWMKNDPQEPQSIWWLTRMDVVGFRVVIAENDPPELRDLAPKVIKKSE